MTGEQDPLVRQRETSSSRRPILVRTALATCALGLIACAAVLSLDHQNLPSELAAVVTSSTGLGGTTATTVTLQHAPPAPSVYVPYPVAPPPPMLVVPPPPAPPGAPGPPGPGVDPAAAYGVPIAQAGPMLVPQPDYSDVLDRITRELSTDTMEIANLDSQVNNAMATNRELSSKYKSIFNMKIRRGPQGPEGVPGIPGPAGERGPPGTPGVDGQRGPRGLSGKDGIEGPPGPPGVDGKPGLPGISGPPGPAVPGPPGAQGTPGMPGKNGIDGSPGVQGISGPPGNPGKDGADGVNGSPGLQGPPGLPGPQGLPGPRGRRGTPGATGQNGERGPRGAAIQGQRGPVGPRGLQGPQGPNGREGPQGPQGRRGRRNGAEQRGSPQQLAVKAPTPMWWQGGSWGQCYVPSDSCQALGVKENLCGECSALPNGGFKLYNPSGLNFDGYTFDDAENAAGSIQVRNVCLLAKYGNKGDFGNQGMPTSSSKAIQAASALKGPHFFGECEPGSCATCLSNSILSAGQDFRTFSIGGSCSGDHDLDKAWAGVECHFE